MAFARVVEHQLPTAVILRTPVTQIIIFNQGVLLLGSETIFLYVGSTVSAKILNRVWLEKSFINFNLIEIY